MCVQMDVCLQRSAELAGKQRLLTSVKRHMLVLTSHTLIVLSREPEIRNGPGRWPFFACQTYTSHCVDHVSVCAHVSVMHAAQTVHKKTNHRSFSIVDSHKTVC